MTVHLFLTGAKRVGKSTLVQKLLRELDRPVGGFYTRKVFDVLPDSPSVHLLRADRREEPSRDNLLFRCIGPRIGGTEAFDRLGCAALIACPRDGVLVMDELGPHEGEAAAFRAAVLRALDSEIPILGVLQQADAPFLRQIAAHPSVRLLTVTEENRNRTEDFRRAWALPERDGKVRR